MKITIVFKDPDAVSNAMASVVFDRPPGLSDDEWYTVEEERRMDLDDAISSLFDWGEYAQIEYDTETKKAVLVPDA